MKKILLSILVLSAAALLPARAENIIALTSGNRLITVDHTTPAITRDIVVITGLPEGEALLGLDYRPTTGGLYALGSTSRLYLINTETGAATAIGSAGAFTLTGTRFGFDFNPTVDRIRVTSDADQNIRLHPDTGALFATDATLQYGDMDMNFEQNPNVVGSAYTNSFTGSGSTILYDIDSGRDVLAIQNPPNAGTLNTVGSLGVDASDNVGFDISGITGTAFASLTVGATTNLYTINLLSGAATSLGALVDPVVLGTETVVDIIATIPPSSRLLNLATRGRVGEGEDVLIGGFIARAGTTSRYVMRALGPSLTGVTSPLADPVLTVIDANGQVAANDDWQSSAAAAADITATNLAPGNAAESALLLTLPSGAYTFSVSGKGSASGVASVEIYQLQ
jgi:hypothetical protein